MATDSADRSMWSVFRNRWVKLVLAILVLVGLGWLVYELQNILVPFGLAVVAAYIFNPLVRMVQKRLRWRRMTVVLALVSVLTLVMVAVLMLGFYYAWTSVEEMVPAVHKAIAERAKAGGLWERLQAGLQQVPEALRTEMDKVVQDLPELIKEHFQNIAGSVLKGLGAVLGAVWGLVVALFGFALRVFNFVLFFVVMAYLLIDLPKMRDAAKDLLPVKYKDDILRVLKAIDRDVHAFFRGQLLVALALGVIYSVGLLISGVDFALIIGPVAGMANMVPYLGIVVGMGPAILMVLLDFSWLKLVGAVLTFVIGQTIEGFYLTPKIVGENVGLNPVAVILAILIFGQLLGFLGVIFAVPLAAAVKVLLHELIAYYKRYQAAAAEAEG